MIQISFEQKEAIGFQYVLEALAPCSAYGAAAVKALKPFSPGQEAALQAELDNIGRAIAARPLCETQCAKLERVFMRVKDIRRAIGGCGEGELSEIELFEIKQFLLQTAEIIPLFDIIQSHAGFGGIVFKSTAEALNLLDPEGNRIASFHISGRYSAALTAVRREKRLAEEAIRQENDTAKKDALHTQRRDLAAREEAEERVVRQRLTAELGPYKQAMLDNCRAVGALDLVLQKAKLAQKYGGVKPRLVPGRVCFQGMTNPQMADNMAAGKSFTPVSIDMGLGATVITGANMGGKSVALKTAALNVLLVSCGFYAFAQGADVCLFDSMHLVSDDLEDTGRGLSSFGGEIVRLGQVVEAVKAGFAFVLMDEFARGTNPHEGAAIARGAVEYLNRQSCIAVLTTHYDGVAQAAGGHYQVIGLRGLDFDAVSKQLSGLKGMDGVGLISRYMNYGLFKVEDGQDMPRDALNICRLLGLESEILALVEGYLKVNGHA